MVNREMNFISRRQFLQHTATLSLSAGAASLLPASIAHAISTSAAGPSAPTTLADGWEYLRMPLAGPWEVWSDQPLAPWSNVTLPHCFNSYDGCDPETPAYRGKGWYRRVVEIDNPFPGGRTLLHFEGAGQSSAVYLGSRRVVEHVGGYDEFVVDITETRATTSGKKIQLSVLCDNSPDLDRMPSDLSDFTLYGGLYRPVHLVYVPAVSLERVQIHVKAAAHMPAQITVQARLHNPTSMSSNSLVTVRVLAPDGSEVFRSSGPKALWKDTVTLASFALAKPALWSPRTPQLYECRVTVRAGENESTSVERFGVRFYEFQDHGPFLLNGERLLIQGTHRHEDHAGFAAAMPASLIREEMKAIRDMGANFIRLAHYQQQRLVLDLCDELGLLVWEELSWCRGGIGDEAWQAQGREKLTTLIDQHRNHPSIILWGLGNEDDWEGEYPAVDQTAIRAYMQKLTELAHSLDDGRLTSYRRCDFARDIPDVYSPSIWAGWYGGRFVDYEGTLTTQRDRVKRMLHVEWGADSHAGRHAEDPYKLIAGIKTGDTAERGMAYKLEGGSARVSKDGDWSETYACDLFDWHLKVQQSLPWLTGAVQWIFKDFTTPLRPENPVPRVNQKGVAARDLTKKESYYVFQSYWSEKPMVRLYGHSWPVRWGAVNEPRTVKVYSNCATAELFVNDKSAGVRKRDSQNFPAAGLRWDVPFEPGKNSLRVVATAVSGETLSDELSFTYQTETWGAPTRLALAVVERSARNVTVEATLMDAHGVLCLDARNAVSFSIAGDAKMIDNQGTSNGSRRVQLANGRGRISILAGTSDFTAAVSAEGIASAFSLVEMGKHA
jgi:beta-galactosidase